MQKNNNPEKIASKENSRSATLTKIAHITQNLPEREQEKIYCMIMGFKLAGIQVGAMPETQADTA